MASTRLDVNSSPCAAPQEHSTDDSVSYIQVVVQKRRCAPGTGVGRAERVPRASSPLPLQNHEEGAGEPAVVAASTQDRKRTDVGISVEAGEELREVQSKSMQHVSSAEHVGPACVEVFYFEQWRGGQCFVATGGAGDGIETRVRAAGRAAVGAGVCCARVVLGIVRDVVAGVASVAGDVVVKPSLAVLFNAAVRPPLVFLGNVFETGREALRPLWLGLGDALEPAVRLLSAPRLVNVSVHTV